MEDFKGIIEAVLFAAGRIVEMRELQLLLEKSADEICEIIDFMNMEYEDGNHGIEIVKLENGFQLASKAKYYDFICRIIDNRNKPKLSNAALETLSIIAYNPRISRAEIEAIRGVNVDGTIYKLLEYGLIEEAGKLDLPGKPMSYKTTQEFLKMFGYNCLKDLPELPRYKLDENKQIVIDELIEEQDNEKIKEKGYNKIEEKEQEQEQQNIERIENGKKEPREIVAEKQIVESEKIKSKPEAPMPEREDKQ